MFKMIHVSTTMSTLLLVCWLTCWAAADDDFSWGNLFGGWGGGGGGGDDSGEGSGRRRSNYGHQGYNTGYQNYYRQPTAGYTGYNVNPWHRGYYYPYNTAGGDSSGEGGGGGWNVPMVLPGNGRGQGRGQGGDSSGEGGWGRSRWGTNVNILGRGGGGGGGGGSSDEDGRGGGGPVMNGAWGKKDDSSEEVSANRGNNAAAPGPVMHNTWGGARGGGGGGDSSQEEGRGGGGPVMHNIFGTVGGNGDSSEEKTGGPVMHNIFGTVGGNGDSSEEKTGGPIMHNVFGTVGGNSDSSEEKSGGPVMHKTGRGDSSEELTGLGGPVIHNVWGNDSPDLSDDSDVFNLHFGNNGGGSSTGGSSSGGGNSGNGGGGVRPPTPQPPTRPPVTTRKPTEPTTPFPTPYPGAKCQQAADVAVLVDISDSLSPGDLHNVQRSLDDLVDDLKVSPSGRHMAVLGYASQLYLKTPLSGDPALLKSRVQGLKPQHGLPDTALAMREMMSLMSRQGRPGVPKSCIVIMDQNSANQTAAVQQAALARSLGIQMLVIGVGLNGKLDFDELKDLADDSYHLLFAENFGDLPGLMNFATTTLCPAVTTTHPHTTSPSRRTNTPVVVTTPKVTTARVTTPRFTTPRITTARITTPTVTTPRVTTARVTTPRVTTPRVTPPRITTPRITTPRITTPRVTTPRITTPRITTPRITTPRITTPRITTPRITTPRITTPRVTTPRITTPTTPRPSIPAICDNCTMVNGVGYKAHWAQCDLFIQCQFLPDGTVTVRIKQCPHGLHWDQNALTCSRPAQARCATDPCRQPGYQMYSATNNCRGYWECVSGTSEGRCCPTGYGFAVGVGCVPDAQCQDSCGVSPTTPDVCDKRAVAQMPLTFEQYVPGAGWKLMFCAPGTAYNHTNCGCTDLKPGNIPDNCRAELYLPFNGDIKDESGNNNFVQNEGVKVINDAAYFNGNAVLRVPRFANTDYGDFVLIRLRYKQDLGGKGGSNQALIANGDCLKPSSLYMVANQQGVNFGAKTTFGKSASVNVPNTSGGWKEAVMYVDRHTLTGSVNNYSMQTLFAGSLATSKCALQIGRGTNFDHFKGYMDDITVYLCRPKTF